MALDSTCPTAGVLEEFLLGKMSGPDSEQVEEHLGRCPTCAESLEAVRAVDRLVEVVRQAGDGIPSPQPAVVRDLVQRVVLLQSTDPYITRDPTSTASRQPPPQFSFLRPAEGPDAIGLLGGYRVLRVLGEGGMGVVFEAEDVSLQRRVALKVIKPNSASSPESRERFKREGRSIAALQHDHVIPVYQYGEDNGVLFLVLPLLQGQTLADRLRHKERPSVAEVVRLGREVAEGLAAAHAAGIIHRDVKPGNLWLEGAGEGPLTWRRVKVLDFGLARPVEDDDVVSTHGRLVGTPAYMSPEQAHGKELDGRADLFSLGCVLYEMLTGSRPFPGATTMAVLTQVANHNPPPPCAVNKDVPAALSDLVVRLLSKDSSGRPASAAALLAELTALENTSQQPEAQGQRQGQPRRRLLAAAGLVVLLGGLAASVVAAVKLFPPKETTGLEGSGGGNQPGGPNPPPPDLPSPQPVALAAGARGVFKQFCHRCHHGPGSEHGDFDVLKPETLTALRDGEPPYVVAGKPAESLVFQRLALRKGGKGDMPPKAVTERPSDADKAAVKAWIEAGAPAFPETPARNYVSTKDVLAAIRDDLRAADREDRRYLRYFTLAHLHNNPKVPDADLRVYRAALAKAVNSLSWKPDVVVPRAVGPTQTVFAIDVRKLDWDREDRWRLILRAYPYGLGYDGPRDADLQQLDADVRRETDCEMPVVRADWFVATATRPPLYHDLLHLPADAGELEKQLGVDVAVNFRRDELARAGFLQSGVSGQNRLVERHTSLHGAYWKSYDFKAGNPRGNLTQLPLGPEFPGNPFAEHAFAHDGGEILFHLPNGLQGYFLVDGKDKRIDAGPIAVVGDALKTSGTNEIVTGLSCMACHKHGLVPFTDQVREGTAVLGDALRKVQRLYPEAKAMNEKVQADSDKFLTALEKATGPFLKVGADAKKDLRDSAEPVGESARLYRLQDLDLTMTACELDVEKPADLRTAIENNPNLRKLGLAALLQPGGAIKRADWERLEGTSLMQDAAFQTRKASARNVR